MTKRKLRAVSVIIWALYILVALASYFRHHDGMSIAMIVTGVIALALSITLFRIDR